MVRAYTTRPPLPKKMPPTHTPRAPPSAPLPFPPPASIHCIHISNPQNVLSDSEESCQASCTTKNTDAKSTRPLALSAEKQAVADAEAKRYSDLFGGKPKAPKAPDGGVSACGVCVRVWGGGGCWTGDVCISTLKKDRGRRRQPWSVCRPVCILRLRLCM